MNNALENMFPNPFNVEFDSNRFTVDMAKQIHGLIGGDGLIENAGNFRNRPAKPAHYDFEYLNYTEIDNKMIKLFKNARDKLNSDLSLNEKIKLGAKFLSKFLYIHPFSNGNGRVGRLLLSYILSSSCVVPVTLFSSNKDNDDYLDCLVESRGTHPIFGPLAEYILLSIRYDIEKYLNLLDIWGEFLIFMNE